MNDKTIGEGDTIEWSDNTWRVSSIKDGLARLVRLNDGPGPLSSAGDSVLVAPSVLD